MRPSGDKPGAVIFFSIFFIKIGRVAVGAEQDVLHPFRGFSHLLTDNFKINAGAAFDNQFIVNVSDDKAVAESLHSIAEDIGHLRSVVCGLFVLCLCLRGLSEMAGPFCV